MPATILLIEDDASTATSLQKVLRAEGYSVDWVARGDDGLARAKQQAYDLVLTDFRLPGLSGLDLVAFVRYASVYKDFKTPEDFAAFVASQGEDKE